MNTFNRRMSLSSKPPGLGIDDMVTRLSFNSNRQISCGVRSTFNIFLLFLSHCISHHPLQRLHSPCFKTFSLNTPYYNRHYRTSALISMRTIGQVTQTYAHDRVGESFTRVSHILPRSTPTPTDTAVLRLTDFLD